MSSSEATPVYYDEDESNVTDCRYMGTEHVEVKIYLIGVFATLIAVLSILFNTFFTLVFIRNQSIRKSSVFYFGILAVIDTVMAVNYIAVMSLPVYMDYYHYLPMYQLFLSYFRIVLTESNCAMFASMLMILLATTERLLRTFDGDVILKARRFLEKHRPLVSSLCIGIAVAYKFCVYWEIGVKWKPTCEEGWGQYEIIAGPLTQYEDYRFWWMFMTRNIVDRILPFFVLIAMNCIIIRALKKEYKKYEPKQSMVEKDGLGMIATKVHRGSLRDATRALISIVTMYILSQSLQVLLTFSETFYRTDLEEWEVVYSYLNDIVSIMTLLSSCLRFPVYYCCNRLIHSASADTMRDLRQMCCGEERKPKVYEPISSSCRVSHPNEMATPSSDGEMPRVAGAIYNDRLKEWQL